MLSPIRPSSAPPRARRPSLPHFASRRGDAHGGPALALALDLELAAVGAHQVLDDGEPEPGASELARAGLVHAVEALGDPRQVFGGNADSGVLDRARAARGP